jgi:hypothetical protein
MKVEKNRQNSSRQQWESNVDLLWTGECYSAFLNLLDLCDWSALLANFKQRELTLFLKLLKYFMALHAQPRNKYEVTVLRESHPPLYFYITFPTVYKASNGDLEDRRNCVYCSTYKDCFVYVIFPTPYFENRTRLFLPYSFLCLQHIIPHHASSLTRSHPGRPVSLNFYVTAFYDNSHVEYIAKSAE